MTKKEANDRAKFFYKKLFGLNFIYKVDLVTNQQMEELIEKIDKDEQIFKIRYSNTDALFIHPEEGIGNKDEASIIINKNVCKDIIAFNDTLIHELTHCALWWTGYDSNDGDKDFEDKLKELGLSSNYDIYWTIDREMMRKSPKIAKIKEYERMYQEFKAGRVV